MGKLDFLKIKKELCFKRHYPQSKKVTLGMGEIICKSYIQGINIQNIQGTQSSIANKQIPRLKDGQNIPRKIYTNGQVHEKMFQITNHEGNGNQKHNKILPYTH